MSLARFARHDARSFVWNDIRCSVPRPKERQQPTSHRFLGLILVVGHELAHANPDHLNKRRANAVIGWIGGVAADAGMMLGGMSTYGAFSRVLTQAGARAFSVAFEREADYVGAYMSPVPATTLPVRRNLTHILAGEP
jgi:hypothetical protein